MSDYYETLTLEQLKKQYEESVPVFRRNFGGMDRRDYIRILSDIASSVTLPKEEEFPFPSSKEERNENAVIIPQEPDEILDLEENTPDLPNPTVSSDFKEEKLSNSISKSSHSSESKNTNMKGKSKSAASSSPIRKRVGDTTSIIDNTTSITYKEFQKEIRDDAFIKSFTQSIQNLIRYKLHFYKKKLKDTEEERSRVQEKAEKLKREGATEDVINTMYPMRSFYTGLILNLKEIIEELIKKVEDIDMGWWNVKANLIDAIENEKEGLLSIQGRENVKNSIAAQMYAFGQNYKTFTESFNNICLLGGAGVGKTRLAKVISYVYSKCGLLVFNFAKTVSRADLVDGRIGFTASKTNAVLMETLESILFIDEAYQLGSIDESSRDFGPEAITEIVNFLDKYIGMNIVIVAGYQQDMMTRFFPTNEGLERRFPIRILLQNYSSEELFNILINNIQEKLGKKLDEDTRKYISSTITIMYNQDKELLKNQAGDMLNLATSIVKAINSSYRRKWKDGNFENNMPIIKDGFNEFLKQKEYILD